MINGDLRQKFRDYLRDHGVCVLKKRNVHIYTPPAHVVRNKLDCPYDDKDPPRNLSSQLLMQMLSQLYRSFSQLMKGTMKVKTYGSKPTKYQF